MKSLPEESDLLLEGMRRAQATRHPGMPHSDSFDLGILSVYACMLIGQDKDAANYAKTILLNYIEQGAKQTELPL